MGSFAVHTVSPGDRCMVEFAATLLYRFFLEEAFSGTRRTILENLKDMIADQNSWIGLAFEGSVPVGVVTVSMIRYVEWGRVGEIGDLYVMPSFRGRGVGASLINMATFQCIRFGCKAISVVTTPEGEKIHNLSNFYKRHGFRPSDRSLFIHVLTDSSKSEISCS